jgi:hypothetical protein
VLKEKSLVVASEFPPSPVQIKKGADKPWSKPPLRWVKLSIDGSFFATNGKLE